MRKITISVGALLAISAVQVAHAATVTVDFSSEQAFNASLGGIFAWEKGTSTLYPSSKYIQILRESCHATAPGGYFTVKPSQKGALTINVSKGGSGAPTIYVAKKAALTTDLTADDIVFQQEVTSAAGTATALVCDGLEAGVTYYILTSGKANFYGLSYAGIELPTADKTQTLTIQKGKNSVSEKLTLCMGVYKFTAPDGYSIAVSGAETATPDAIKVAANDTQVTVTVSASANVSADTEVSYTYEISGEDLQNAKAAYTQKIAVMINKANVYTNDETLRALALDASSLMAAVNNGEKIGLDEYDEYTTTGAIAALDKEIETLGNKITAAKAVYDSYDKAQNAYGQTYDVTAGEWKPKADLTGTILEAKADLDAAYEKALGEITDESAREGIKGLYEGAIESVTDYVAKMEARYANKEAQDENTIKAIAQGVIDILNGAKDAIENGGGNAVAYANVNTLIEKAKIVYNTEAGKLYTLLTGAKDGETYNDMYVNALADLNAYLRIINNVKAENDANYANNACNEQTQAKAEADLAVIIDKDDTTNDEEIYGVYAEYEAKATTLRANYEAANADIADNLTGYLKSEIEEYIGKRTEVATYYKAAIDAIKADIAAVQGKVDEVNAAHTIAATPDFYETYGAEKAAIITTIDNLKSVNEVNVVKSVAEYDAWQDSKAAIKVLQDKYDAAKKVVTEENKSDDEKYDQATKFSAEYERTIQERIKALADAADASFNADGSGTARTFYAAIADNVEKEGVVTLYGTTAIGENIDGYSQAAAGALIKYNEIAAEIVKYDAALNGTPAQGEEGKDDYVAATPGLVGTATNTDVTIDGSYGGTTYAAYIKEKTDQINALKTALSEAIAKNDTVHVNAMAALTTINGLVDDIKAMEEAYGDNETAWNKEQLAHAKESMLAEANRRLAAIDTKNAVVNYTYTDEYNTEGATANDVVNEYQKDTYGLKINDYTVKEDDKDVTKDGLNTRLKTLQDAAAAIQKDIDDADASADDAAAIALLSQVASELTKQETVYGTLADDAKSIRKAYTAEKLANKELSEAVKTVEADLAKVTFERVEGTNLFATEVSNQTTAIATLKADIAAKFAAETVVANKEALAKTNAGIATAVANLNGLVEEEKANKTANDEFNATLTEANVDKAITDAAAAIAQAVTDGKVVENSAAYSHFMGVFNGYKDEYDNSGTNAAENKSIKKAQETAYAAYKKVYEADGKTILAGALDEQKYTDATKNMVALQAALVERLNAVKANIEALPQLMIDNEAAYNEQVAAAGALDKLRAEVFDSIANSEQSSYHAEALLKLKNADALISEYKAAYDEAYGKGENDVKKTDIEAKATSAETILKNLKDTWTDEYSKAVGDDNLARKQTFDEAYTTLTKVYATEVDVVTRMSKLSYADGSNSTLEAITGEGGIYDYATKIRDLKTRAEAAYAAATAPTLFDAEEAFTAEAGEMQAKIQELSKTYTDEVNAIAMQTYTTAKADAKSKYDAAIADVKATLGISNEAAAAAFEDVKTIMDEAQGYETLADFACYLDNTILPAFATIDAKVEADKENAAVKSYTDRLAEYRALAASEASLIAGYNKTDGTLGGFSKAYATFVEGSLDAAEKAWAEVEEGEKYANFAVAKAELDEFANALSDRKSQQVDGKPEIYAELHTATFWSAYDDDQVYHANDYAYNAMVEQIADVQKVLDAANGFVNSLIIRNNSGVNTRLENAQTNIDNLAQKAYNYHKNNTADSYKDYVKAECDRLTAQIKDITEGTTADNAALVAEFTALGVQINALQHDYNQATAANIDDADIDKYKDVIAAYTAENKLINRDFVEGKYDEEGAPLYDEGLPVKATAEETRLAYLDLEKRVGVTKSELTALYNAAGAATAQQAVQDEIDKLTQTYDDFVAQLADCHAPVVDKYQAEVDAFKAEIDALQAVLDQDVADNTVLLYQDVNIESAKNIANTVVVSALADRIANDEKPYDVNDAKYEEILGQLNQLTENLNEVSGRIEQYEYQRTGEYTLDLNGDGEISEDEMFGTYREYMYACVSYWIAKDTEWLEEQNKDYKLIETSAPTHAVTLIQRYIDALEKNASYYNAQMTLSQLSTDISDAEKEFTDKDNYAQSDRDALRQRIDSLKNAQSNADTYNSAANRGTVYSDIDGNPIEIEVDGVKQDFKTVKYMEEYPDIMAKAAELSETLATLNEDIDALAYMKGDVNHSGNINVADYDAVRQMVLQMDGEWTAAMQYAADVNNDGVVNIGDVNMIGGYITGAKTSFETATSAASHARRMAAGADTYGQMMLAAEGAGLEQTIKVAIDSRLNFTGAQFDVVLPAGIKLTSVASTSHDAMIGEVNGATRVLVSNLENTEIVNGQAFVELNVEVSSDYNGGEIEVRQALFADADGTVFSLAKASLPQPTAVTNLTTVEKVQSKVYSVGGQMLNAMKKGINIIVNADGTTRKQVKE